MTNIRKINYQKIYLFELNNSEAKFQNPLKEFLYFLKSSGKNNYIDFSYSCEDDSLHSNLTIKENFMLDAIPTSLIRDNEINVNEFIKNIENDYLKELITLLGNLDTKVKDLPKESIKLTSIIKAILSQTEYIFFNEPDRFLKEPYLNTLKNCILHEVKTNNRIVMLKAYNNILWPDIITNIISKDDSNNYINTTNPLLKNNKNTLEPNYSFSLKKAAS